MIALITGWTSPERDVCLLSGRATAQALEQLSYEYTVYDFPADRDRFLIDRHRVQSAIIMIHGAGWEDGQIAAFLDVLGISYQCESAAILALTHNKRLTKQVRRQHGVPVAHDRLVDVTVSTPVWTWPCVIKALDQWSSIGVVTCRDAVSFVQGIADMTQYGTVMIEELLEWSECTVSIISQPEGTIVLPIVEIIPPDAAGFDYSNKYNGLTKEICPARYDAALTQTIQKIWLDAYHACWCRKYGRVDIIVTDRGPVCLEINTIPGFTAQSLFPKSAQAHGWEFAELVRRLVGR